MPKAGYCAECEAHVWLYEDGSCERGHPATSVSQQYDAAPVAAPALEQVAGPKPKWRALVMAGIIVLIVLLVGVGVLGARLLRPLASRGSAVASEWDARLTQDYPGWKKVGFNFRTFQGAEGSETTYSIALVPPGADFSVPVVYVAKDGSPPVCQDEVLRPAGRYHEQAESLLAYIDRNYYGEGKSTTAVSSDSDGVVTVEWIEVKRFGPFTSRYGSFDEIAFDEPTGQWQTSAR